VRIRALVALIAVPLLLGAMSACESNVGKAATVNGQRISDSDVDGYLTANAVPFQSTDQNGQTTEIVPRTVVLGTLLRQSVLLHALVENGGEPSQTEIDTGRTSALQGLDEAEFTRQVVARGFTPGFAPVLIQASSYLAVLQARADSGGAKIQDQITTTVNQTPVSVNPRYGTWDPKSASITGDPADAAKSFLTISATSSTS
jgi:hypothetical protein